jgi:hypothetical protein
MGWLLTGTWSGRRKRVTSGDSRPAPMYAALFDLKSNSSTQIIPDQNVINVGTEPSEIENEA